ncbi:transposase [Paraburkholderia strydomiana]
MDIPAIGSRCSTRTLIRKYKCRLASFDHVISMHARHINAREVRGYLSELYGLQVSPEFSSIVTAKVQAEIKQYQQRPPRKELEDAARRLTAGNQ